MPSATEIIYALGLEDELCGVTHECDYPPRARLKQKLTASALPQSQMSKEIDARVSDVLRSGQPIYSLDYAALEGAAPDVIFTQEMCEVCAVSFGEIQRAAMKLPKKSEVISLDTFTLNDILDSIRKVGAVCNREKEAQEFLYGLKTRIANITRLVEEDSLTMRKKKMLFMEWIDPPMCGGHWMSELINRAGGEDRFAKHGMNSARIDWEEVRKYAPDYLVIAPCGFGTQRAEKEAIVLHNLEGWSSLPAVKADNVFVSDGNAYFSRPGPRIVDGLEILALILNPGIENKLGLKYKETDYKRVKP